MSKLEIKYPPGATPLNADEKGGLIPDYITAQGELNALEQENILEALAWATGKKKLDILTQGFAYDFHKRMFNRVWKWAGRPRQSDKFQYRFQIARDRQPSRSNLEQQPRECSKIFRQMLANVVVYLNDRLAHPEICLPRP